MSAQHPFTQFHFCPKCGSAQFVINNHKSKRCEKCGFVYYFNPSAATAAIIVNNHNEILVCRRAKDPAIGTLDLPGGFVDCFETSEEGVVREVKEETGLEVVQTSFLFSLPNTYLYSGFLVHTVDFFFRCKVENITHCKAMDDADQIKWIPFEKLNPNEFGLHSIQQGIKKLIQDNLL